MPSLRVLARILLVLLLLADGVLRTAIATEMAVPHPAGEDASIDHDAHGAATESPRGCETGQSSNAYDAHADGPADCSCMENTGCSCNYLLTLHPGRMELLFWLDRSSAIYRAAALLAPPRLPMSRVFRPPIG